MATTKNSERRKKIRMRLTDLEITQVEAAKASGISGGQFSQIMNGYVEPSDDVAERIATALGRTRRALVL